MNKGKPTISFQAFALSLILCATLLMGCGGGNTNDLYFEPVGSCDQACCSDNDCGSGEKCYQNACMATWSSTFGGTGVDSLESVIETTDGGFFALGSTMSYSPGKYQGYVMKLDSSGTEVWSDALGGTGDEFYFETVQDRAGSLVIAGSSNSFSATRDSWTLKLNILGTVQGSAMESDTPFGNAEERIFSIDNAADGGIVIAGYSKSTGSTEQALLIKYGSDFKRDWWASYGNGTAMRAYSVRGTLDGGYVMAGKYGSSAWIMKTDGTGTEEWSYTFGTDNEVFFSVRQLFSGGYVAVGSTVTFGTESSSDVFVVRLDAKGSRIWAYTYGGSRKDEAKGVVETSDRGLVVVGYSYSFVDPVQPDALIIKLDKNGNKQWLRRYGASGEDFLNCVNQASDGGLVFSGFTTVDVDTDEIDGWVFKSDPAGYVRGLTPVYTE